MLKPVSDKEIGRISKEIASGRCVLVIGPEATATPGQSVSDSIARFLAGTLEVDVAVTDAAQVVQQYLDRGGYREDAIAAINAYFDSGCDALDYTALKELVRHPFSVILSTSHDPKVLDIVRNSACDGLQTGAYNRHADHRVELEPATHQTPVFYSLFGSLVAGDGAEDDLRQPAISSTDQIELIESLVSDRPPLPSTLERAVRDSGNVFLFLGFGFDQWYSRMLLYALLGDDRMRRRAELRPSFALEADRISGHTDAAAIMMFCEGQHRMQFRKADLLPLVDGVASQLPDLQQDKPSESVGRGAPVDVEVFLSYRHVDAERVSPIRDALESRGIKVWQDVKNLRGGDRWERAIERVIKKVDRFVLIQSDNLVNADESVVFEELAEALKRDRKMNPGRVQRFIVPVCIDDDCHMEQIDHLHFVDLANGNSVQALIDSLLPEPEVLKSA